MTDTDRERLRSLLYVLRDHIAQARRIQALLLLADGVSAGVIARRMQIAPSSINRWRKLYEIDGLEAFINAR